jgi:hypothetical protein
VIPASISPLATSVATRTWPGPGTFLWLRTDLGASVTARRCDCRTGLTQSAVPCATMTDGGSISKAVLDDTS